ncbi:hypothetical protein MF406_16690 [Georgenia sp. TF02-10]|uniref:hypothetical protein n=1 Tax=Georgenia sp. TF02-10 TaxID=2917725 RepID=UPI001FA76ADA|nr:hypothetical protein [Georgenia sp. TF02-10]UNX54503.1 hypothetical protein MF406_16690 [Georgenia sp. TF02-10]
MMYTVKVSREGRYWVAEVADVPGGATETERLADLDHEVRDLLAGLLDVDEGSLELAYGSRAASGPENAGAWEAFVRERDEV